MCFRKAQKRKSAKAQKGKGKREKAKNGKSGESVLRGGVRSCMYISLN